jgi:hypothetical protein
MMWLKRNLPVLVAAAIFCFFVVLSLYLLKGAQAKKSDIEIRHRELDDKLKALLAKNPFPSEGNIRELKSQTVQLSNFFAKTFANLPKQRVEYTKMEPLKFKGYLEKRVNTIRQECEAKNVKVATGINFGFGKYVNSNLRPKEEETDKLQHQLDILESLIDLLTTAGVVEITAVRRTPVEGEDLRDERVEGAVWNRDPKLIYESQSVELAFRCSDEALKSVLNRLANSTNQVLLVRYISVESERATPREPTASEASPTPRATAPMLDTQFAPPGPMRQPTTAARTARGEPTIVMGNEMTTVNLRLDVIELKVPEEKSDSKAEKSAEENKS